MILNENFNLERHADKTVKFIIVLSLLLLFSQLAYAEGGSVNKSLGGGNWIAISSDKADYVVAGSVVDTYVNVTNGWQNLNNLNMMITVEFKYRNGTRQSLPYEVLLWKNVTTNSTYYTCGIGCNNTGRNTTSEQWTNFNGWQRLTFSRLSTKQWKITFVAPPGSSGYFNVTFHANVSGNIFNYTLDPTWNSTNFMYARQVNVRNNNDTIALGTNYTVNFTTYLNTASLISAGKMQADCDDLTITYNGTGTPTNINRDVVACNTASTQITWKLQASIAGSTNDSTSYVIQYGNNNTALIPMYNKDFVYWVFDDFSGSFNTTRWTCDVGTCTQAGGILTVGGLTDNRFLANNYYSKVGSLTQSQIQFIVNTSTVGATACFGYGPGETNQTSAAAQCGGVEGLSITSAGGPAAEALTLFPVDPTIQRFLRLLLNGTNHTLYNSVGGSVSVATGAGGLTTTSVMKPGGYRTGVNFLSFDNFTVLQYIYPEPTITLDGEFTNASAPSFNWTITNITNSSTYNETFMARFFANFTAGPNPITAVTMTIDGQVYTMAIWNGTNSTSVTANVNVSGLRAGNLLYSFSATDGTAVGVSPTFQLTIQRASIIPSLNFSLNGTAANRVYQAGETINASGWKNTSQGNLTLFSAGLAVDFDLNYVEEANQTISSGNRNYSMCFPSSANYTGDCITYFASAQPYNNTLLRNILENGTQIDFNVTVRNSTQTNQFNVTSSQFNTTSLYYNFSAQDIPSVEVIFECVPNNYTMYTNDLTWFINHNTNSYNLTCVSIPQNTALLVTFQIVDSQGRAVSQPFMYINETITGTSQTVFSGRCDTNGICVVYLTQGNTYDVSAFSTSCPSASTQVTVSATTYTLTLPCGSSQGSIYGGGAFKDIDWWFYPLGSLTNGTVYALQYQVVTRNPAYSNFSDYQYCVFYQNNTLAFCEQDNETYGSTLSHNLYIPNGTYLYTVYNFTLSNNATFNSSKVWVIRTVGGDFGSDPGNNTLLGGLSSLKIAFGGDTQNGWLAVGLLGLLVAIGAAAYFGGGAFTAGAVFFGVIVIFTLGTGLFPWVLLGVLMLIFISAIFYLRGY